MDQPNSYSNATAGLADYNGSTLFPAPVTNYLKLQRNTSGKFRPFGVRRNSDLSGQLDTTRTKMDDLTQLSSMSPTQENPESAYEHYALPISVDMNLTATRPEKESSEHTQRVGHDSLLAKHHSAVTDSTARTYGESDTGHVYFDHLVSDEIAAKEDSPEREESMSQDTSFAPREEISQHQPYEPQTPAPPVNPFSQKGSVLKANEMFKATQPSSTSRHLASTTSSRPSPNVYNDFTSPAKWIPPSSPLVRHLEPVETSPLQSSVRTLLCSGLIDSPNEVKVPQPSRIESFDVGLGKSLQGSIREPLGYVSMKESQERRRKEMSTSSSDSQSECESDFDDIPFKRQQERKQREEEIRRQLSTVELQKIPITSNLSASPSPGDVEVPSTSKGRRRSTQEDYIAQCEGTDARDTQQDDVIVDSQTVPNNTERPREIEIASTSKYAAPPWNDSSGTTTSNVPATPGLPARCHGTEMEHVSHLEPNIDSDQASNALKAPGSPFQQPSLPLQEVSTNRNDLRTPSISKTQVFSDGADITVPETSPSEDHIRPIGDIANISFGESKQDELQGLPGFTPDTEFENAMMLANSDDGSIIPAPQPAVGYKETEITTEGKANRLENQRDHSAEPAPQVLTKRDGLRSKDELKGPSRALRRSGAAASPVPVTTPQQTSRVTKLTPATKSSSARSSKSDSASLTDLSSPRSSITTPRSLMTRSSTQRVRGEIPVVTAKSSQRAPKAKVYGRRIPSSLPPDHLSKRKSSTADESILPKRSSKRQLVYAREHSADPLALSHPFATTIAQDRKTNRLFTGMAFAVSYVNQEQERNVVTADITEQGGLILEDGFDGLFDPTSTSKPQNRLENEEELVISAEARKIGFVALIADEHSRRVKYMQALALSLPCISGRWISECVSKDEIVDWAPYLLCAGQSSFLGNAIRSRTLQPYSPAGASFSDTFTKRVKFLGGKSILVVTGKGRAGDKRKHYLFLTRVLGPARLEQVSDLEQARKILLESTGQQAWDLVYVDENQEHADKVIFGQAPTSGAGSKKRKRGPAAEDEAATPERVRIITDEVIIQSLILGQWME